MERRNFVMSVLAGGVMVPTIAGQDQDHAHGGQESGPLANATVSFGNWRTKPPLDRFLAAAPPAGNVHAVRPFEATIKAGGAVNFVISGFHILGVYAPGTEPEDINGTLTAPIPGAPTGFPPVVNDPLNRLYRGNNPFDTAGKLGPNVDRVEAVNFPDPGRFLFLCLFLPHFNERMHGFVEVVP